MRQGYVSIDGGCASNIAATAEIFIWLDHHVTSSRAYHANSHLINLEGHDVHVVFNPFKSGALLAWEWFFPDKEPPYAIQAVDDADRFQFRIEGSREYAAALHASAPWSFETFLHLTGTRKLRQHIEIGSHLLKLHAKEASDIASNLGIVCNLVVPSSADEVQIHKGLAANCPASLRSDVGAYLAKKSKTFGLSWYVKQNGVCRCSMRSQGSYDVSAIAEKLGGGGHRNAAGFDVPLEQLVKWLQVD